MALHQGVAGAMNWQRMQVYTVRHFLSPQLLAVSGISSSPVTTGMLLHGMSGCSA